MRLDLLKTALAENSLILLLTAFSFALLAQPGRASLDNYIHLEPVSPGQNLSQNQVNCILQDHKGFLWVGTKNGLNGFDGYQFVVYRYDPYDLTSLSDNFITALLEDRRGRMWVGTQQGLNLFDRAAGTFSRIIPDSTHPTSLSHPIINDITEGRQGNIVVATWGGGLNILTLPEDDKDSRDIAFKHIRHFAEDHNSLSNDLVRQVVVDDRGVIWASTSVIQSGFIIVVGTFSDLYIL